MGVAVLGLGHRAVTGGNWSTLFPYFAPRGGKGKERSQGKLIACLPAAPRGTSAVSRKRRRWTRPIAYDCVRKANIVHGRGQAGTWRSMQKEGAYNRDTLRRHRDCEQANNQKTPLSALLSPAFPLSTQNLFPSSTTSTFPSSSPSFPHQTTH